MFRWLNWYRAAVILPLKTAVGLCGSVRRQSCHWNWQQPFVQKGIIDMDIQLLLLRNIIGNVVEKIELSRPEKSEFLHSHQPGNVSHNGWAYRMKRPYNVIFNQRRKIADYLDIVRPSLSWTGPDAKDGIIRIDGHKVQITDQDAFDTLFD